jgi:hypothetical protein
MYQAGNSEGRENRISVYAFNPDGGEGNGSHFQDPVTPGHWIMVAGVIGPTEVRIYKDGDLRDRDRLDQSATGGLVIRLRNGRAPLRLGTRDRRSFFLGALDEVAVFPRALTRAQLAGLLAAASPPG